MYASSAIHQTISVEKSTNILPESAPGNNIDLKKQLRGGPAEVRTGEG